MQVYKDKLGCLYTEKDYYRDPSNLNLDLVNFPSEIESLRIEHEDFVASVPGFMTLEELDSALQDMNMVSRLYAPKNYSISRILAENLGDDNFKQVLGLNLQHLIDGKETKTGGKVIKNVSGYDLSKIYIGSCNSLALINNTYLRLEKNPEYMAELSLSIPAAVHKNLIDLKFISFLNSLASIDFDNSLSLGLFFDLSSEDSFSLELRIRLANSEDLLAIKTKKLTSKLIEFLKDNYSDLNLAQYIKLEKKIFKKKYPKLETKLEFHTKLSDLIPLYRRLIENSKEKNKTLNAENKIRLIVYPKSSKIELYCPRPILDSWLESLYSKELPAKFYLRVLPVSFKNKRLERKYNQSINEYEIKLLRELKSLYDPKGLINPGILIRDDF